MPYTVIAYNRGTGQFDLYLAGDLAGHASTMLEALTTMDVLAYGSDDDE